MYMWSRTHLLCDLVKYKHISIVLHSACHYFRQMLLLDPNTYQTFDQINKLKLQTVYML